MLSSGNSALNPKTPVKKNKPVTAAKPKSSHSSLLMKSKVPFEYYCKIFLKDIYI